MRTFIHCCGELERSRFCLKRIHFGNLLIFKEYNVRQDLRRGLSLIMRHQLPGNMASGTCPLETSFLTLMG